MKVGTRSLFFGVHQVFWHPLTVLLAWQYLYGWPSWKEFICIVIHDWGYWGRPNMDGLEGERHPEYGARIAGKLFGTEYYYLCLLHSRHYAKNTNREPSRLCWADKLSIRYDPWWFYLLRAWGSGELKEYRLRAAKAGAVPLNVSNRKWFHTIREVLARQGLERGFQMAEEG